MAESPTTVLYWARAALKVAENRVLTLCSAKYLVGQPMAMSVRDVISAMLVDHDQLRVNTGVQAPPPARATPARKLPGARVQCLWGQDSGCKILGVPMLIH